MREIISRFKREIPIERRKEIIELARSEIRRRVQEFEKYTMHDKDNKRIYISPNGSPRKPIASLKYDVFSDFGYKLMTIRELYVGSFYNKSPSQGLGIGRFLINKAINYAKEQGLTRIILISNPNAVEFYKKLGFRETSNEAYRGDEDYRGLELNLD